ncbi:MAG: hypothetical protein U0R19_01950 [Bryobacteraceae bacterium]
MGVCLGKALYGKAAFSQSREGAKYAKGPGGTLAAWRLGEKDRVVQ